MPKTKKNKATKPTSTAATLVRLLRSANRYGANWGAVALDGCALEPREAFDEADPEVVVIFGIEEPILHELRAQLSRWEAPELDSAVSRERDDGGEGESDPVHTWVVVALASHLMTDTIIAWLNAAYAKRAA